MNVIALGMRWRTLGHRMSTSRVHVDWQAIFILTVPLDVEASHLAWCCCFQSGTVLLLCPF